MWFRKRIVKALTEIYECWKGQLEKVYENYYLKLWLFEPNFYNSQVVVGIEHKINYYNNLFDLHEKYRSFPTSYQNKDCDLISFNWVCCLEKIFHLEEDLSSEEIANLEKKNCSVGILDSGKKFYSITLGYVWVGSKI
jgi:hypothetical protein